MIGKDLRLRTSLDALRVAMLVAVAAGAAELAITATRKWALDRFILFDWQIIWMTPLSYAIWLLPLGLVLAVGYRVRPRWVPLTMVIGLPVFAGAFAVLFLFYPSIHRLAILVLALGVAVQVTRLLLAQRGHLGSIATRTVMVAVAVQVGLGIVLNVRRELSERAQFGSAVSDTEVPNVLLLVWDAARAINLSLYGHGEPTTPSLDRMARDAMVFDHAFATAPWTLTSHSSMFTGRYPYELSAGWRHALDDTYPTLAEVLRDRGYATAGFVANLEYCSREVGLSRGFTRYEDYRVSLVEILVSSSLGRFVINNPRFRSLIGYQDIVGRRSATDIATGFLDWQDRVEGRPFFAFLNMYDAHEPYLPPEPYASRFPPSVPRNNAFIRHINVRQAERAFKQTMSAKERVGEERAYDAGIAYMDGELGRILDELERRGVLDNTVVIVTADHGELFGEHDLFTHGNSLYAPLLHVPLVIRYPARVAGGRTDVGVSLRDLPATILDLVGVDQDRIPGASLVRARNDSDVADLSPVFAEVEPAPNQGARYPSSAGSMQTLIEWPYQLIHDGSGGMALFDLEGDPGQLTDLSENAAHSAVMARITERFSALMSLQSANPRLSGGYRAVVAPSLLSIVF